jgi:hypothetical protein
MDGQSLEISYLKRHLRETAADCGAPGDAHQSRFDRSEKRFSFLADFAVRDPFGSFL